MTAPLAPRRFTDPHKRYPSPPPLRELDEAAVRAELRAARAVVAAARRKMPGDARECRCFDCRLNYREIRESVWAYDAIVDAERARLAGQQLPLDLADEAAGEGGRVASMEERHACSAGENGGAARETLEERPDARDTGRTPCYEAVRGELRDAAVAALNDELAVLRAAVARLTSERDAAGAALDGLVTDVEDLRRVNHYLIHSGESTKCDRGVCPGLRRAVARAGAAREGE